MALLDILRLSLGQQQPGVGAQPPIDALRQLALGRQIALGQQLEQPGTGLQTPISEAAGQATGTPQTSLQQLLLQRLQPTPFNPLQQLGIGLMQAGGPSKVPVSFLSALGSSMAGMQKAKQAHQATDLTKLITAEKLRQSQYGLDLKSQLVKLKGLAMLQKGGDPIFGKSIKGNAIKVYNSLVGMKNLTPEQMRQFHFAKQIITQPQNIITSDGDRATIPGLALPPGGQKIQMPGGTQGGTQGGVTTINGRQVTMIGVPTMHKMIRKVLPDLQKIDSLLKTHSVTGVAGAFKTGPGGSVVRQAGSLLGWRGWANFGNNALKFKSSIDSIVLALKPYVSQEKSRHSDRDMLFLNNLIGMQQSAWQRMFQDKVQMRVVVDRIKAIIDRAKKNSGYKDSSGSTGGGFDPSVFGKYGK